MALNGKVANAIILLIIQSVIFSEESVSIQQSNNDKYVSVSNHEFQVAWIDTNNARIFVVVEGKTIANQKNMKKLAKYFQDGLKQISNSLKRNQISGFDISFFSERKYATYKDSIDTSEIIRWEKSYLGEYSSKKKEILLHPLNPKLMRIIKMR